jgi:hypothetical protein
LHHVRELQLYFVDLSTLQGGVAYFHGDKCLNCSMFM